MSRHQTTSTCRAVSPTAITRYITALPSVNTAAPKCRRFRLVSIGRRLSTTYDWLEIAPVDSKCGNWYATAITRHDTFRSVIQHSDALPRIQGSGLRLTGQAVVVKIIAQFLENVMFSNKGYPTEY